MTISTLRSLSVSIKDLNAMSIQDSSDSEANLMMDLVQAKCGIFQAQKVLADSVLQENEVLSSLLRFQAETAGKRLDDADLGLGYMQVMFKKHGWIRHPQEHLCKSGCLHAVHYELNNSGTSKSGRNGDSLEMTMVSIEEDITKVWVTIGLSKLVKFDTVTKIMKLDQIVPVFLNKVIFLCQTPKSLQPLNALNHLHIGTLVDYHSLNQD
ncbi:hypothetical protein EV702DRAFT_1044916 [Suillus placidus]|uniref:Uncharacterized protein n=1 Tax=Suillus placidus TaxID=48579 RepID=A0A9P6ZWV6_9AGAM|nr:hypothetical protein EV702DRAFT_1044916 [Suillus placidus]